MVYVCIMSIFKKHISFLLEGMVDMLSTKFWIANVRSMAKEVHSELEVFERGWGLAALVKWM